MSTLSYCLCLCACVYVHFCFYHEHCHRRSISCCWGFDVWCLNTGIFLPRKLLSPGNGAWTLRRRCHQGITLSCCTSRDGADLTKPRSSSNSGFATLKISETTGGLYQTYVCQTLIKLSLSWIIEEVPDVRLRIASPSICDATVGACREI